MMNAKILATAVALALTAGGATAASLNVTAQSGNNGWPFPDDDPNTSGESWWVSTSFTATNSSGGVQASGNVAAGVFRLFGDDGDDNTPLKRFLAFCLQPLETLSLPKVYEMTTSLSASVLDNLNALGANAWLQVQDDRTAAAFQMAVWEIANETQGYDIHSGDFAITGTSDASNSAELLAQSWLDRISGQSQDPQWFANGQSFMVLSADGTQDLFTDMSGTNISSPVPLPASGLLMLGALAGAGAVARRKARKA